MSPTPFDLLGRLPQGTVVLEASAGTGKTFTIAGLVARYVAEGAATLDELLVVTFGRAATQELRDRVRERLVSARDGLADPPAARAGADQVLRLLAEGTDDEVSVRRTRLTRALADFDAATVATMHEFSHRVLATLGVTADVDADAVLVENLEDLVDEVVQDLYVRKWAASTDTPAMDPGEAHSLARTVVADGHAELVPEPAAADQSPAAVRWRFAQAVCDEVDIRKRRQRILGYDDWLTRLRNALQNPQSGASAISRLRARYRVVLVDEFQDTDPVQWDILKLAFHQHATLVLIGDPKQAIYAFRGADVHAYLDAVHNAEHHATLVQNWRSDPALLDGLKAIFRDAALGDARITVAPVAAAHSGRALATEAAPVQIRIVPKGSVSKLLIKPARERVVADLVREVVRLLETAPTLTPRDGSPPRALCPGDIAVIVSTNVQLDLVHDALASAGVPSVQRSTRSVFRTPAADDWTVLLEALEQPHRSGRVRRLAVSPFVGWDAAELETKDVDRLGLRLRHWLSVYEQRGVAAAFETISRDENLPGRLLSQTDGERRLTDLRHVAEALHAESLKGQLGLTAGLEWLRRRTAEAANDGSIERSRRLDSDAEAVQLVTVWMSKGLEFPVVMFPFGWDRHVAREDIPLFHVNGTTQRVRNVGGQGSADFATHQTLDRSEKLGEDLRLLYVALTRAQAQVTAWWTPSERNTSSAPLHRLLFAADPATEVPESGRLPTDAAALTKLQSLEVPWVLSVTAVDAATSAVRWSRTESAHGELKTAVLERAVDVAWRRTSYSAMTAAVHDAAPVVASEPEVEAKDDEPEMVTVPDAPGELSDIVSPMDELPGGTAFGTMVHAVLEEVDFRRTALRADLVQGFASQLARAGPGVLEPQAVADALLPALHTPLGPLADDQPLSEVAATKRLNELDFELPLGGGDRPHSPSRLSAVGELIRDRLPSDDPLRAYADALTDPSLGDTVLEGYLAGSIDAVILVGDRFVVVDYKTNRLGDLDRPVTAWDYRTSALSEAMIRAHYPLQALLYSVALHRFLRWRVADYDPCRHLGGVLYLFLRGMCGPSARFSDGSIPGVFGWRPPQDLIVAASDLLAGGT